MNLRLICNTRTIRNPFLKMQKNYIMQKKSFFEMFTLVDPLKVLKTERGKSRDALPRKNSEFWFRTYGISGCRPDRKIEKNWEKSYCKIYIFLYFIFLFRLLVLCAFDDKFHFKNYLIRVTKVRKNITSYNLSLQSVIDNKFGTC